MTYQVPSLRFISIINILFFLFPLFPTFLFLKNSSPAFSRSLLFSVSSPISRTKVSLAWSNSRQDPTSGPQVTTGAYSPDTHSLAKPQVKGSNQTADKSLLFIMYIIVWLLSIWLKKKKGQVFPWKTPNHLITLGSVIVQVSGDSLNT